MFARILTRVAFVLAAIFLMLVALSGCGHAGSNDPPPPPPKVECTYSYTSNAIARICK